MDWRQEPFRKPDKNTRGLSIWYGPGGWKNAETATMVEEVMGGWEVSGYQHVEGYIEDYDKDVPFLRTRTTIDAEEFAQLLIDEKLSIAGSVDGVIKLFDKQPLQARRWVAMYGTAYLSHYGGSEEFIEELPR